MSVDLAILTAKTYYAVQVILKGQYQPLEERKYYTQYFILAIIYYYSSLLKYILIEVAFMSGTQKVYNRIVITLLSSAATGVLVYIPCLVVALRESDKKHA